MTCCATKDHERGALEAGGNAPSPRSEPAACFAALRVRRLAFVAAAGLAVIAAGVVSLMSGTIPVHPSDVLALLGPPPASSLVDTALRNIRLPRLVTGALVGCNLALSGAVLQGVLRNPLASPQVIGVNAGAGLAAVSVMILFPGLLTALAPAAFLGALGAAAAVHGLSRRSPGDPTTAIVLAGVAVSALLSALTSGLMILHSDELDVTFSWLVGGLSGRSWGHVRQIAPYSAAGAILALYLAPKLDIFALGDETGAGLGLAVKAQRTFALMVAALLAGSAVSVAGTIGFVGLIAPHAARFLVGNENRYVVVLSGLLGMLLIQLADLSARLVFQPAELPVGVVTAALGAPFFLLLLTRRRGGEEDA